MILLWAFVFLFFVPIKRDWNRLNVIQPYEGYLFTIPQKYEHLFNSLFDSHSQIKEKWPHPITSIKYVNILDVFYLMRPNPNSKEHKAQYNILFPRDWPTYDPQQTVVFVALDFFGLEILDVLWFIIKDVWKKH